MTKTTMKMETSMLASVMKQLRLKYNFGIYSAVHRRATSITEDSAECSEHKFPLRATGLLE